ncbi:LOW QUALITY PROTEIN: centrosomal protein of 170 kDa [Cottoperca gobio]|uniref:LOW QUALITY PROTEIN: centrosomal protein of 170 kDa n=1 Tax=Cottoperca gobio TaxID=56716 RepID=A0A6J2R7N5_COTGO|nr:LOW QUALITY PROTEIN: centrosomal protein of 170 kDa [Cottoperca gobio]
MSVTSWFLVSSGGTRHRLPREMIFVGRDDCELMLQSRSVDKQHAVINYEVGADEHKVKDLGSLNGTFVNDVRIQEQMYITLKLEDKLRFGYDTNLFTVVRGELTVPEEALKHEKFTSGLQLSKKPPNIETPTPTSKSPAKTPTKTPKSPSSNTPRQVEKRATDGVPSSKEPPAKAVDTHKAEERLAGDVTALPRGTPLYGQPSWWGDGDADDENSFKQETKTSNKKHDSSMSDSKEARRGEKAKDDSLNASSAHDSSYFEMPTKEGHMANNGIHEIPTKDTEGTSTAAQGHASFTIEFDSTSPGKVTIKDHVSKFIPDHHRSRSKKSGAGSGGASGRDLSTLQAAMMASESKVADWLAQNDPTLVRSESTEDDSKSIKSDVPVHLKRLKGSKHDDGTQSDSENGVGLRFANRRYALEERLKAAHSLAGAGGGNITTSASRTGGSRTSFMIELYDEENPRKRRSYSFSQTAPLQGIGAGGEGLFPQPPSHPKVFSISTSAATASDSGKVPAPIPATVTAGAPTAARVLLKQRSEDLSIGRSSISTGLATGSPTSPSEDASVVGRGAGTAGGEAEDDHSDKGTYTIELENRNAEEEEARRMIDKVFGVQQNQEDSSILSDLKGEGKGKETGEAGKEALACDSSWVSEWASLAANHTRTDPEGSGAETAAFLHKERGTDAFESGASLSRGESSSSLIDRKRRTLPQLPVDDPRAKSITKALGLRSEIGEKQDTEPQEKENKGDGESPTPMRDGEMTSKRKQSSTSSPSKTALRSSGSAERRKRSEERKGGGSGEGGEKSGKPLVRQGSFTIEKPSANVPSELIPRINRGGSGRERSDSVGSMDTATLLKDTEAVMAFLEAKLRDENKLEHKSSKSGVPSRTDSISPESDVDTASTTSHVAGEAERRALDGEHKRRSFSSMHREKSNISTTSKTSVTNASARDRLDRKTKTRTTEMTSRADARRSVQPSSASSRARHPSVDLTDDDQTSSFPISDILSSDQETYSGPLGRSAHGRGSDDVLHSKLDSRSTKTSNSGFSKSKSTLQSGTASSMSKQAALPQPRPTRASLLRRARLGDTSDTDLADADRQSVASEVSTTSSTSKPPSGRKGLSRLDLLAQPRRTRVGSISARSDSECIVTRSSTSSPRLSAETALRLGLRSSTPTESRLTPRMRANSVSKLNETRTKTTTSGYCSPTESSQPEPEGGDAEEELMVSSSSRWRRLPPEYGSTSEEEFGSNRNSPKHGGRSHMRPHHLAPHRSSRLGTAASPGSSVVTGPGGGVIKHRMKEQEEYIKDWTAHSEEIARISQDLAKDLAILAREIHDVAGEIDSVSSSGTAPSTTVSTAATTPGSAIDTREELVDRVFDESLNFRKIPPVITTNKAPEINGKPVELRPRAPDSLEPRALRRRTWNREEAVLDSLLLNSVSQLSTKIRHSIDKTAGKIRILFKDKDRNWDEIENKLRSESDMPLLKTTNKEFSSILLELKRVEKQLQVINVMVDPDGTLDALVSLGLPSPTTPSKPQTAKTTSPSATSPGSALPAKESLPEIFPGPGGSAACAKVQASSTEETARDPGKSLGLTGVGGRTFNRMRPSGEEAIAQK